MTALVLLVCAAGLTAFPALAFGWGRRLPPAEWARLCTATLITGTLLTQVGLILCAAPVVFDLLGITPLGIVGRSHIFPGGAVAGWTTAALAGGGLAAGTVAIVRSLTRHRRIREALDSAGSRSHPAHSDVTVLAAAEPVAMAVPAQGGTIVISDGLMRLLDGEQVDSVIRHERAHLANRHHHHLLLSAIVRRSLGRLPWVAASLDVLSLALERWADEEAVRSPADRRTIRQALLRLTTATATHGAAGFSSPMLVAERIRALERPAPTSRGLSRPLLYLLALILTIPDIAFLVAWMS